LLIDAGGDQQPESRARLIRRRRGAGAFACEPGVTRLLTLAAKPKRAVRILFALTLCSACAIDAYGWSSASLLHLSTRQEEKTMTFVGWIALGLAAGLIGSGLVEGRGEGSLPYILIGVVGAMAGGWLWYTWGPAGINGLNLVSHFAAVIGSLAFLVTYYALRRV